MAAFLDLSSSNLVGDLLESFGEGTPGSLDDDTEIASISLTASMEYEIKFVTGSSFHDTIWRLEVTNDATVTDLQLSNTGPGNTNFSHNPVGLLITAGASGTQHIKLIARQQRGALTDIRGGLCALERL